MRTEFPKPRLEAENSWEPEKIQWTLKRRDKSEDWSEKLSCLQVLPEPIYLPCVNPRLPLTFAPLTFGVCILLQTCGLDVVCNLSVALCSVSDDADRWLAQRRQCTIFANPGEAFHWRYCVRPNCCRRLERPERVHANLSPEHPRLDRLSFSSPWCQRMACPAGHSAPACDRPTSSHALSSCSAQTWWWWWRVLLLL